MFEYLPLISDDRMRVFADKGMLEAYRRGERFEETIALRCGELRDLNPHLSAVVVMPSSSVVDGLVSGGVDRETAWSSDFMAPASMLAIRSLVDRELEAKEL